jgi:hypothetical protein
LRIRKKQGKRRNQKKIEALKQDLIRIEHELTILKQFRRTPQIERLERHLHGERSYVKQQIRKLEQGDERAEELERAEKLKRAQDNRSEKNRRNWRYWKAISMNFNIPIRKVRSENKKRRKGLKSDIDDVIWRNPSP